MRASFGEYLQCKTPCVAERCPLIVSGSEGGKAQVGNVALSFLAPAVPERGLLHPLDSSGKAKCQAGPRKRRGVMLT